MKKLLIVCLFLVGCAPYEEKISTKNAATLYVRETVEIHGKKYLYVRDSNATGFTLLPVDEKAEK